MTAVLLALLTSGYIALQNSKVQTRITRHLAKILSERLNANISVARVDVRFFRSLYLEDVLIEDMNRDTLLFAHAIKASIDTLLIKKHYLSIDELTFDTNKLYISKDSADTYNFNFILEALGKPKADSTGNNWLFRCRSFRFKDMNIDYRDLSSDQPSHFYADDLNLEVSNFTSQANSISLKVNNLNLKTGGNLVLESFNAEVNIEGQTIDISQCNFESRSSQIANTSIKLELPSSGDSTGQTLRFDVNIAESHLNFRELSQLIPTLRGMDQMVEVSGQIYGDINDLKGKSVRMKTGQSTEATFDFYINDLLHPENMYLFIDVKESRTNFRDLSNIRLPDISEVRYLEFPSSFYQAGMLEFKGNFSGFLQDFVTFGTLKSQMGTLTTDILVVPEKAGSIYYRGNIATKNFKLGRLFKIDYLGRLTFNGSVDGRYDPSDESVSGIFKGDIKSIEINDYAFNDIKFDGILIDKMFDGLLQMNDSNLQFSFLGQVDLNRADPEFNFSIDVEKARPARLNLFKSFPNAEIAFNMNANFSGSNLDNLDGTIRVNEGYYKNRNGNVNLGGMFLKTVKKGRKDSLSLTSDFLDLDINGDYNFRNIVAAIEHTVQHFVPSYGIKKTENPGGNNFSFRVSVKDINPLTAVFVPGLEMDTPFLMYGEMNSSIPEFQLEGSVPGVRYHDLLLRDIFIGNKTIEGIYTSKFRFGEISVGENVRLYNFKIDSEINNDLLRNTISWSNYQQLTYSGTLKTQTRFSKSMAKNRTHIVMEGLPSDIFIADSVWTISPFTATIDSTSLSIENLVVQNRAQFFSLDGRIQKGKSDLLNLQIRNFNLKDLDVYLNEELEISGFVNGEFGFANLFDKPVILSDLTIDNLYYRDQLMGDVSLISQWNSNQSKIDSRLQVMRNNRLSLNAFGNYFPATQELDFNAGFDSVSLIVLEPFLGSSFSRFRGHGSGKLHIGGTSDKIMLNGAIMGSNAGLTIEATQVPYTFNDSVYFRNDTILFRNIAITDEFNNPGRFNGKLIHHNFGDIIYDLHFTSNKISALNTTSADYSEFYGVAMARGRFDVTGRGRTVNLSGTFVTLPGTEVNISMESENEAEQYDFIEFVTPDHKEESGFYTREDDGDDINLTLNVEATPDARVQLIYNSQIGDVIKAQGEGLLVFNMNPEGDITLSGNYKPTKGDYLFTLQNVINKRFTIEPGGSIIWSGDPYNADIDLKAIYKLKASLYDLLVNRYENMSQNQRVQVECIIHLEDELVNPTISFDINFPNIDETDKDQIIQYFNTDEEMNKQILSLIVLGKFYTPENLRGTYEAQNTNMIGSTASELFSNQLSNWLSKINENWDVGVNYRPGNQVTDDEIELALSTQIFNDRVTLNGNIGNNSNQYNTNSSQIVGDFEINVKLVPSGKIQFKAYNRSNNNLIYETAPYTQGIGLSYTEEYNSIEDLLRKFTNLFKRKRTNLTSN